MSCYCFLAYQGFDTVIVIHIWWICCNSIKTAAPKFVKLFLYPRLQYQFFHQDYLAIHFFCHINAFFLNFKSTVMLCFCFAERSIGRMPVPVPRSSTLSFVRMVLRRTMIIIQRPFQSRIFQDFVLYADCLIANHPGVHRLLNVYYCSYIIPIQV